MPRKLRLEYAGACYHVINRGNYRRDLFAPKGGSESFQACLFEACAACGWRLHAFVLMRNHFHLALETPEPNLSVGMKWLQGTWAVRFNRFRGEQGRPFQGRFKALHVEPGHALAQVAHYIHLNPVRAGVVAAARLLEYRWSSLPLFARRPRPACLQPVTILAESGGLPDTRGGWRRYVDYLGLLAETESRGRSERFRRLSQGWTIGSDGFRARIGDELKARSRPGELQAHFEVLGADREAQAEARNAVWEARVQAIARAWSVDLQQLPRQKSALEKLRIAAVMKRTTSVSNRWIACRLEMGAASSIGPLLHRFWQSGAGENCEFAAVLSRFST